MQTRLQRQARIGEAIDQLPDPFIYFDGSGTVLAANHAAEEMLGGPCGRTIHDLTEALGRISKTPELTAATVASTYENLGGSAQRIAVPGGSYELRCQVSGAGRALLFRHVGRSDEAPEAADETRFEQGRANFLALMSHDLRTPLNSILGFAEIIALQALGARAQDRYQEYAQDIVTEATRLHESIDALITLASLESEAVSMRMQIIDANVLVRNAVEAVSEAHPNLSVICEAPETRLQVKADPDLVHQALVSILGAMARQHPEAEIVASAHPRDDTIVFSVALARSPVTRADERFEDADYNTGLWIGHTIAIAHGGGLRLADPGAGGTEIRLLIPEG